ncbi:MAG TPA: ABC transporter ATP-binding protein [Casimicrobiaceae bacterium]
MIELRDIRKTFGAASQRVVLDGLSLRVARGEFLAVRGESGVGKSTLLNLIAGLDRPDSGSVVVDDVELGTLDDDGLTRLRRERIGFVFQAFHVLPYLSVAQNVALPLALNGRRGPGEDGRVIEMLEAMALGERATSAPRELSGGELQRVAIARALVHRPSIVLADEPTGNLDPHTAAHVITLLRAVVKREGATVVLVTHSPVAAAAADRVIVLRADGFAADDDAR